MTVALGFGMLAVICLIMVALYDFAVQRIPNMIVAMLITAGIALHLYRWDFEASKNAAFIFSGLLAGGFLLYVLGWFGAGDAKLLAACSLWVPPSALVEFLVFMSIAGGVMAFVYKISQETMDSISHYIWQRLIWCEARVPFLSIVWFGGDPLEKERRFLRPNTVPYGVAMACACVYIVFNEWAKGGQLS